MSNEVGRHSSAILLYSRKEMFGDSSGNQTITETLTASGTLTASATFGFTLDGISLTVNSSGSGETEYKSAIVNRAAPPDLSTPTEWTGAWHYPEMRTEVTVTTTGSFAAAVTLGFSLTDGLTIDVHFSADFEIVSSELTRTEWIYLETSADGVNNYWAVGYDAIIRTAALMVNGNFADGFDFNLEQDETATGDATSGGTSLVGSPITTGPTRLVTHWNGTHETVYLEVEDLFGHPGPFTIEFSMYGENTDWTHWRGFVLGAPGQIQLIVRKGPFPQAAHFPDYPEDELSGSAEDAIRLIRAVSAQVEGEIEGEIRNQISAAQLEQARSTFFYGKDRFECYYWGNQCITFAQFCRVTYAPPSPDPEVPFPVPFGW